jgi:predicted AAA+ superfamily ATPase
MANLRKAPKLLHLDIGLVNYQLGIRSEVADITDINAVYHGQVGEQIAGQTLLSLRTSKAVKLYYWYREQKGAVSEIDYLMSLGSQLCPVEVKSGKSGSLKSLHNFMDESTAGFAIRIYSGRLVQEQVSTPRRKRFTLLSVPFYLMFRLEELAGALSGSRND